MQHQICNLKKPHNSHKPIKISDFSGFIWPGCGRVLCLVPLRTGMRVIYEVLVDRHLRLAIWMAL